MMAFEEDGRRAPELGARERPGDKAADDERAMLCSICRHRITEPSLRIEISGAHEHTFVNPGGFVHHLGCWAAAAGCSYTGVPETAFSWFPGWSWQIADCGSCRVHIGWLFRCAGDQFHGLIVARLIEGSPDS